MGRVYLSAAMACLSVSLVACYWAVRQTNRETIPAGFWPEEFLIECGGCHQGDLIAREVVFKNTLPDAVTVTDVATGCSCMQSALTERKVPPGGTTTLRVQWDVGARRNQQRTRLTLIYQRKNGGYESTGVELKAFVVPDINYEPDTIDFDGTRSIAKFVSFTAGRRKAFRLLEATVNHAAFKAGIEPDGCSVRVQYDATILGAEGPNINLTVATDSEVERVIAIPIRCRTAGVDDTPRAMPTTK